VVSAARVIALATVAGLPCACSPGHFDDLRDQSWSDSSSAPDGVDSSTYPVAIAPLAIGAPGVHVVAAGTDPVALATISYDRSGSLDAVGVALSGVAPTVRPTLATVAGASASERPWVAVGGLGSAAVIQVFDARTGVDGPILTGSLDASACSGGVADLGLHMVWTRTILGDPNVPDLIATAGNDLVAFPDLDPAAATHPCFRCTAVGGAASTPRDVLAVTAADLLSEPYAELIVALRDPTGADPNQLAYFGAGTIETDDGANCFSTSTSVLPGPHGDFGTIVATGDLDGDGLIEVVATTPGAATVEVFPGVGDSGPSGPKLAVASLNATATFGAAIAIGDVDGDGLADLIVGDPNREQDGVIAAGAAVVFGANAPGSLLERAAIAPARSEDGQRFGHVLSVSRFTGTSDTDLLVSGTTDALLMYFRAVAAAADPRE
jgi:hypothetical protein